MRLSPPGLVLATLLAGFVHAHVVTAVAGAATAVGDTQAAQPETERSVSLVIRVKPDQLKKVASDLSDMVQGGKSVGLPWLKEAFGAISAEIVVEDAAPTGEASTAFRASSAGWVGRDRPAGSPRPSAQTDAGRETPAADAASGTVPSIDPRYATAAAIIGRHASAIRDGAAALMETLPDDQTAQLRAQLEQLAATAGSIGKSLEGLMPARADTGAGPPKR